MYFFYDKYLLMRTKNNSYKNYDKNVDELKFFYLFKIIFRFLFLKYIKNKRHLPFICII